MTQKGEHKMKKKYHPYALLMNTTFVQILKKWQKLRNIVSTIVSFIIGYIIVTYAIYQLDQKKCVSFLGI